MAYAGASVNVLVVAPAWVGDMVMAHCLVPGLVERGAEVDFLAPMATADLATRMPGVAGVHRIHAQHGRLGLRERHAAAKRLRRRGFEHAIVLPNSYKSALTPLLAGIPRRTGFRGEFRYGLLNDMRQLDGERWPRMVDRFAALADVEPQAPALRFDGAARHRIAERHGLARRGLPPQRPLIALCPGADYGSAKRWPLQRFQELARLCANAGAGVWVVGGSQDAEAGAAIAAATAAVNLAGRTSLLEAVDLLSAASAVVSNDSGLMHIAAALGVPVAAVYGSTSPAFTPPLSAQAAIIERELNCRPCFRRECPLGHRDCLHGIAAAQVFDALVRLGALSASAPTEVSA